MVAWLSILVEMWAQILNGIYNNNQSQHSITNRWKSSRSAALIDGSVQARWRRAEDLLQGQPQQTTNLRKWMHYSNAGQEKLCRHWAQFVERHESMVALLSTIGQKEKWLLIAEAFGRQRKRRRYLSFPTIATLMAIDHLHKYCLG